jgi:hypothetical protein
MGCFDVWGTLVTQLEAEARGLMTWAAVSRR